LPAFSIGATYHGRRQIQLFFKWIKQRLCIKALLHRPASTRPCTEFRQAHSAVPLPPTRINLH
jgi:hypothetical protein